MLYILLVGILFPKKMWVSSPWLLFNPMEFLKPSAVIYKLSGDLFQPHLGILKLLWAYPKLMFN